MTKPNKAETLPLHLERLAADADDIVAMLTRHHEDGGDIHPEALAKAADLNASLKDVIHALTHHEHLAMDADDVWAALTIKHRDHDSGYS